MNKLNKKIIPNMNNYNFDKKSFETTETNSKLNYNSQPLKKDLQSHNNKNTFNSNNIYKNEIENSNELINAQGIINNVSLIDNNEVIAIHFNFIETLLDLDIVIQTLIR